MSIVNQCRDICNDLANYEDNSDRTNEDKSAVLLALYHFEALSKLTKCTDREQSEKLLGLFKKISLLPQIDAKTFESVAGKIRWNFFLYFFTVFPKAIGMS